jgi:hypothetical protein
MQFEVGVQFDPPPGIASRGGLISSVQPLANLIEAEPFGAQASDQLEPGEMVRRVVARTTATERRWHQPLGDEVPHHSLAQPARLDQLRQREAWLDLLQKVSLHSPTLLKRDDIIRAGL